MRIGSLVTRVLAVAVLAMAGSAFANASKVLGKLGQALSAVPIYAAPTTASRIFYTAKENDYLVLQPGGNGWTKVVMNNGICGYVSDDAVKELPYNVVSKASSKRKTRSLGSLSSRGTIADYALRFEGTPYKWGGNDLTSGIDCSGFVKQLYGKIGLSLPRTAAEQAMVGKPITRLEDLRKGDRLYFWENKRGKIGHTGIYLGNGYFVHSSRGHRGVSTDYLGKPSWLKILVAARR